MQTLEPFLSSVKKSGLLDPDQVDEEIRALTEARPMASHDVAAHFIERGLLTGFQARKLLAGRTRGLVLGPFHLLAPLGRGGMSAVYLARDTRCDEYRAVKVLPPRKAQEREQLLVRFRREMHLSQLVNHPNLARTTDVGEDRGVNYIAMDYIPGRNLARMVAEDGPLSVRRAAAVFAEVCDALTAAHARGLIHRDLKPSNIMVERGDHARVLDLGLAILEHEADHERSLVAGRECVIGTMDYLAPEQSRDAAGVDGRADLYSLGCSLFFTLTGEPPFPGGTPREKINRHRTEQPRSLTTLNPAVPDGFMQLVRRLMEKDPARRPGSAAAVRDELLRWTHTDRQEPAPVLERDSADLTHILRADTDDSDPEGAWGLFYPPVSGDDARSGTFLRTLTRRLRGLPVPVVLAAGVGALIGLLLTAVLAGLMFSRGH